MALSSPLVFDEAAYAGLASPGGREMFIFKWLSNLDAHLEDSATKDALKPTQERLELILLEVATIPLPPPAAATSGGGGGGGERSSWLGGVGGSSGRQKSTTILAQVPKPTRVVRDLAAKCLARVYEVGQVHRIGTALYAIQTVMQAKRRAVERETRLAALVCAGVLFEALSTKAGFRLLSCFNDFLALMIRFARAEKDESVAVRVEATRAMAKLLQGGGGKTATEAQARDVVKCLRANLAHRSPLLVLASASALEALVVFTPFLRPEFAFDAEAFVGAALVPRLASSVVVVRRAVARLVAVVVSHNISLAAVAVSAPVLKSRAVATRHDELQQQQRPASASASPAIESVADAAADSPSSASPSSALAPPPLGRALLWLSQAFARASRELRAGIVDAYAALFGALGAAAVEAQYAVIARHVLGELLAPASDAATGEVDALALRSMCAWLLREPLARRLLLTEAGKRAAAQCLWGGWLAAGAASPHSSSSSSSSAAAAVLVALQEWRMLVGDLGESARALGVFAPANDDDEEESSFDALLMGLPLERWLADPSEAVRISAAAALAALARSDPAQLPRVLAALVARLQQCCARLEEEPAAMARTVGFAYAIAGVLGAVGSGSESSSDRPLLRLSVPLDLIEWVHSIAVRLLHAAYQRADPEIIGGSGSGRLDGADPAGAASALRGASTSARRRGSAAQRGGTARAATDGVALASARMAAGWALLAGLTSLGPAFVAARARAQWAVLWAAALPLPDDAANGGGFVTGDMPWLVRAHRLQSRAMALAHVVCFLRTCQADSACRLGDEALRRVVASLKATLVFVDNALDAPPPPPPPPQAGVVAQRISQASLLVSHVQVRTRVVECLQTLAALQPGLVVTAMTLPTVRLIELAIGSIDNLHEMLATRMGVAAAGAAGAAAASSVLSPALSVASVSTAGAGDRNGDQDGGSTALAAVGGSGGGVATCLRGFRSGPWGYEAETGTTTLLQDIVVGLESGSSPSLSLSSLGLASGNMDFASNCAVMRAAEHDWLSILCPMPAAFARTQPIQPQPHAAGQLLSPPPPYTCLVDASVQLFGRLFPTLSENAQLTVLDGLVLQLNGLPFNSHRYAAVLTNILTALYAAIRCVNFARTKSFMEVAPRVARAMVDVARAALVLPSPAHRLVAGEIIGCLAAVTRDATAAYLPYLMDHLTSQAIRSRDRFARAGAAVALGSLYSRAGSIVALGTLRQVVVLLHSLASDKDPIVHSWAIAALAEAAMSAGYMFEPYARDTFQMALKLFLSDSHTIPLYASALWIRGRDTVPAALPADCAGSHERILPLRTATDLHAWARQAEANGGGGGGGGAAIMSSSATTVSLGTITAYGRDAAIVHPNSTTHHGRSPDEQRHAIAAALSTPDADYAFVCARADVDAFDARAVLGHLVSSLLLVFGPELQVDDATRDSVLTLLRELRRALPSAGVIISTTTAFSPSMELSLVADPDARWQTAAQFIFATQKQLLFFAPKDPAFLPLFVSNTLRPIMRARRAAYYGHSSGIHSFHRVAVQALEGVLRLYGSQIIENAGGSWTLCDIIWESLVLYSIVSGEKQQQRQSGGVDSVKELLDDDLRRLIHTTASLACTLEYSQLEHGDGDIPETMAVVGALCAVFTKRATAAMPHAIRRLLRTTTGSSSSAGDGEDMTALGDDTDARPFSSAAKQLAIAAIVATLDCVDRLRPVAVVNNNRSSSSKPNVIVQWRSHPLTPLLADLVSVGYMAASAPATQSPTLCCLGQHLLQRLIAQFGDVEDPALRGEGQSVLGIYQAQLSSAFMPVLGETIGNNNQSSPEIVQAAVITATAFVVSGLVNSDRATLTRILRLLAPQPAFFSTTTTTTRRDIGDQTPQMKVIARLTILHAWATIYGYATSRGGGEGILWDALDLHMPLLSCLWMDAIRDTAVIGMRPRDVYEELAHHSCHPNPYDGDEPDIGMGLSLGLESTYVGMVREPLAVWYRAYLPHFLGSISKLLILGKSDAAHTSKCGYDELLARLRGSGSGTGTTADLAVLLFGFTLQELTRLSVLSSVTRYAQAGLSGGGGGGGSNDSFPFVAASARLVGPLDVGGGGSGGQSRGNDTESERIASLQRAGIRVYGPTQPASSAIGAQWLADMDFVSSLLSTLQAILDLNYPTPLPSQEMSAGLTVLFSATNSTASSTSDKAVTRSWLIEELWTHAVSNIVAPLCDSNNGVVDAQQRANRSLRVTAATKALDVALSLLTLLDATKATVEATAAAAGESMLDQWLFAGKRSEDTSIAADGDVPALLGLCAFGRTVVRDIVSTWQAAQQNLLQNEEDNGGSAEEEKKEALGVASACLEILAMVIGRRHCDSAPLVAFWLGLWRRQSMLAFTSQLPDAAAAAAAAASLTGFVRRTTACYGTVDIVNGGDMLSGDANMLSGDVGLVQSMINALLMQLLQSEADTVSSPALGVVAHLLAANSVGTRDLQVSEAVQARFSSVLAAKLSAAVCDNVCAESPTATTTTTQNQHLLSSLLDILACLTRSEAPVPVLPTLARSTIPALAKLLVSDSGSSCSSTLLLDKALNVLTGFATARYADSAQSGGLVMAAVLMLLLSLLPDDLRRMLGPRETCLAEAILGLATRAPETFRTILIKLSASQPTAKRRLELAIRSRSSSVVAADPSLASAAVADGSTTTTTNTTTDRGSGEEVEGAPLPPPPLAGSRIALKSSFGL